MGNGQLDRSIWKLDFGEPERGKTRYNMMKKPRESPDQDQGVPGNLCSLLSKTSVKDRNMEFDFQY